MSQSLGAANMVPDLKGLTVQRVRLKPLPYLSIYLPIYTHTYIRMYVCVILIGKIKQGRLHRKGGKLMEF